MKNFNMNEKNIWVEKLGFIGVFSFLTKGLFSPFRVHYCDSSVSGLARRFLGYLKRLGLNKNFSSFNLSLEKRQPDGQTLAYQLCENMDFCFRRFWRKQNGNETENFRKMVDCYLANSLYEKFVFVTVVLNELSLGSSCDTAHNRVYLAPHQLNRIIIPLCIEKGLEVNSPLNLITNFRFFLRPLFYISAILITRLIIFKKSRTNISEVRPSIWIEYVHKNITDLAFWRDTIKAEDFDIVYYLDRKDTPLSEKITSTIEKIGLKWADAHFLPLLKNADFSPMTIGKLLSTLLTEGIGYPFWYRVFKFEYVLWFHLYKSNFERFKVKILIQHLDTFWKQEVQARAIESTGGIMLGCHWSIYPSPITPLHLFPYHVFFVWGNQISGRLIKSRRSTCNFILPSGLWLTYNAVAPDKINSLSSKVNFVISVFDSSVGHNIFQTPDSLSHFYLRILYLLEKNHSWGAIIKSKNWDLKDIFPLPEGIEISRRLRALAKQGRVVFLEHTISPLVAAAKSNLSVCFGLNSAGIISAIHGYKVIHWDCSGQLQHPFYTGPYQHFIYSNLDELEKAIIKASQGDVSIGDFSEWRQDLNYFNDFEAARRIGKFINDFMKEIIKTFDYRHSLGSSVKEYLKENRIKGHFFKRNNSADFKVTPFPLEYAKTHQAKRELI